MKLPGYLRLVGLTLLIVVICSSCENKDETPPLLSVNKPLDNEAFSVGDSIQVKGNASDDSALESIKIVLRDNLNKPALTALYLQPDAKSYNFDLLYPISDSLLESGFYELLVSASDGINETRVFRQLYITGVDRAFERLIVIAPQNTLKTDVYTVDMDGNISIALNLSYGYQGAALSNETQSLHIIKTLPSVLYTYDLSDFSEVFSYSASPPYPEFNSVLYANSLIYLPGENGDIKGLDNYGNISFLTQQNTDTLPQLVHPHDNYVLAYCNRRGGPQRFIKEYYKSTGVYRASLEIDFSIVAFFSIDSDFALAMGNNAGHSSIYFYNANENYLADKKELPLGMIRCAIQISPANFLIAHDDGIFKYSHDSNSIMAFLPGVEAETMAYDDINQLLYLGNEKLISVYPISATEPIKEISMPYPVLDFFINYTK